MPKRIKYKSDTPVSVLMKDYKQVNRCDAESDIWNNKFAGKTLSDMADGCSDKDFNPIWGIWFLHTFGAETDTTLRQKLLAAIKDSMQAFSVYLTFAWLTDEEDRLLEGKFRGKLPTAEKELENGIVTRAKWQ